MRDAVAEVLRERKRLDRLSPFGAVLSFLLHAALGVAIVVAARRTPLPPGRPAMLMQLAQPVAAAARPAAGKSAKKAVPAAPKKIVPPPPLPADDKHKPVDKSLWGKSTEKSGTKATAPVVKVPPADAAPALPAVGSAGVSALEGDFKFPVYIDRMIALIGQHWLRPQVRGEALMRIYFVISRDGTVRDPQIETSSGNALFDRAALRAVMEASPLPPLPFGYSGEDLGVHLTFH